MHFFIKVCTGTKSIDVNPGGLGSRPQDLGMGGRGGCWVSTKY